MKARFAAWAVMWPALGCLPQMDDLSAYSAEWSPADLASAGAAGESGSAATSSNDTTPPSSADGYAGAEGALGGGSLPLDGSDNAAAGADPLNAVGADAGAPEAPLEPGAACADGILGNDLLRCYRVSTEPAAWQAARDACRAWQGELVEIQSLDEDVFINGLVSENIWIGASDTVFENIFIWSDGSPVTFGSWGPSQPDRFPGPDCVEKRVAVDTLWYDQPCFNERAFVCEKALDAAAP